MSDIFISYRRKPSAAQAMLIQKWLHADFGIDAYVDTMRTDSTQVQFPERLMQAIADARVFVCLLGDSTLESEWVLKEIQRAYELQKFCVPVFQESYQAPNNPAPAVQYLLNHDGVHYLDVKNIFVDATMAQLAKLIGNSPVGTRHVSHDVSEVPALTPNPSPTRGEGLKMPASPLQNALVRARTFTSTRNSDWTPYITTLGELDSSTPLPDMQMCLVPVGKFMMGSDEGNDNEKPAHEQVISKPYWIARYPVTNAQWRVAVDAQAVKEPSDKTWYDDKGMAYSPVVSLSWVECMKFALWLKCSLPSELVWEYAARGVENLVYPWGNTFEAERVIYDKTPLYGNTNPAPIDSRPQGASWVGAEHLSGNVWEWQRSLYASYPYVTGDKRGNVNKIILRGGSCYNYSENLLRCAYRSYTKPDGTKAIGFRIARLATA